MNPISALYSALKYASEQVRRFGNAMGKMAADIENREFAVDEGPLVIEQQEPTIINHKAPTNRLEKESATNGRKK